MRTSSRRRRASTSLGAASAPAAAAVMRTMRTIGCALPLSLNDLANVPNEACVTKRRLH